MEDLHIERIIQIMPSSGLWLRLAATSGDALPGSEFRPVVAIALAEIESPDDTFFAGQALLPLTTDDLLRGIIERRPNEGLRVAVSIFHDSDFEEVGRRLKPDAVSRSHYDWTRVSGFTFTQFLADRDLGGRTGE